MRDCLKITILDQNSPRDILICESNICSVEPQNQKHSKIKMSNGDAFICVAPPYDEWENDILNKHD